MDKSNHERPDRAIDADTMILRFTKHRENRNEMTDKALADKLIGLGEKAIQNNDLKELEVVNSRLSGLIPIENSLRPQYQVSDG